MSKFAALITTLQLMYLQKKCIFKFLCLIIFTVFLSFSPKGKLLAQRVDEQYNPKLGNLNSLDKLNNYIDSVIQVKNISKQSLEEVFLINRIIENRFYHGFSNYSPEENFLAYFAGKYIWSHLSAIVIPDDILKHQQAACSQQAIVMMQILKDRGYQVRKLGLANHFILEVYYENDWKVFDPNKEPLVQGFSHDSIKANVANGNLNKAYEMMTGNEVKQMYKVTHIGKVNEIPAKNARLFHILTKFVSQYFIIFLAGFVVSFWFIIKRFTKSTRKEGKVKMNFKKVSECQQNALAN